MRTILLVLISILLTNCTANRSHIGAVAGSTTTTGACVSMGVENPYMIAGCALTGAFAGAEIMYNSDYDVHNAVFVDHLNTSPKGSAYTNWYNSKCPMKCKDYSATVDISNNWPLIGVGGVNRNTIFGIACQMPDGRWVEYKG